MLEKKFVYVKRQALSSIAGAVCGNAFELKNDGHLSSFNEIASYCFYSIGENAMSFRLLAHGSSDVGLARPNNEDAYLSSAKDRLFLIADGLGGHQAGEIAAREAITKFFTVLINNVHNVTSIEDEILLCKRCYEITNQYIFLLSTTEENLKGMGTTFCALTFFQEYAIFSHAGDSRIYYLHDFMLTQLTSDHSIRRDFCGTDAPKGFLTQALGTTPQIEPDIGTIRVSGGDLFLLCTDGLTDMLSTGEIESILNKPLTHGEKVRTLITAAKNKGGEDNITVILIEVLP